MSIMDELKTKVIDGITAYNDGIKEKKSAVDMQRLENSVKEAEAEYAAQKMCVVFSECGKTEHPVLAAIQMYEYDILGHKLNKEDRIVTDMELVEDKKKVIDLIKFCKNQNIGCAWHVDVEKLRSLFYIRICRSLKVPEAEIAKIKSYDLPFYAELTAREKTEKKFCATSDTQMVKYMQSVINQILPMDEETGKAKYRCNSHDVYFADYAGTKRDKKKRYGIDFAKAASFAEILMTIMNRIITGGVYDANFKIVKPKKVKKTVTEPAAEVSELAPEADEPEVNSDEVNAITETPDEDDILNDIPDDMKGIFKIPEAK